MRGKALDFDQVLDMRALRVIVADVPDCYAVLGRVHERFAPIAGEFDDYIARPKAERLPVAAHRGRGRRRPRRSRSRSAPQAMHEHAEHGVAAHWAYKEAGAQGLRRRVSASGEFEAQVAQARMAVLRQLLAWERDLAAGDEAVRGARRDGARVFDDRIYVFTPQAAMVELPRARRRSTSPTRCTPTSATAAAAREVDGAMVPLNTPLQNGQTVEIIAAKEGGPSLDWLNAELGYLQSARSKAKVRAWFNAQAAGETDRARPRGGREAAAARGQDGAQARRPGGAARLQAAPTRCSRSSARTSSRCATSRRCCVRAEPAPRPTTSVPLRRAARRRAARAGRRAGGRRRLAADARWRAAAGRRRPTRSRGYVTRGKGVAVHRADCSNFRQMAARAPERVIAVDWGAPRAATRRRVYPVDVGVEAGDRQGLLRDISEVFAKEKMNVIGVHDAVGARAAAARRA